MIAQLAVPSRYHALDALRAAMMFLGIYLHSVVAYSPTGGWPYKPAQLTTTLDFSVGLIHVFRMPIFYVMAGFFTALLLQRYGLRRAADNRFWRIVVPFVVGWIILYPLVMFLAAVGRGGVDRALDFILSGKFLAYAHPLHLWFLEYLIVLYLLAVVAVTGVRLMLPQNVRGWVLRLFRSAVQSLWAPLIFAVPSFLAMLLMKHPWLEDPPSFVPVARIVIAYAIPFAFGWLLYLNTDLLETLSRRAWLYAVFAAAASVAYLASFVIPMERDTAFYVARAVHSVTLWLLIFAVPGCSCAISGGTARSGATSAIRRTSYTSPTCRCSSLSTAAEGRPIAATGKDAARPGRDHCGPAAALPLWRSTDLYRRGAERPQISRRAHAHGRRR